MRKIGWIVLMMCLIEVFVVTGGMFAAAPALAVQNVGPEAVWKPGPQFTKTVNDRCGSPKLQAFNDCIGSLMQTEGASPEALAFAKRLDNEGYLRAYQQVGPVGIAHVSYPFKPFENSGILLVNGSPPVIDVDDFGSLPEKDMKQDPLYRELLKEYPAMSLWHGDRLSDTPPKAQPLKDSGESLGFSYRLLDGCRTCKVIGQAHFAFDFDPGGKYLGTRFVKVEKATGAESRSGGAMKGGKPETAMTGSFHVAPGEEFRFSLESNATTGFHWGLASPVNESVVQFVSKTYEAPQQSMMVGVGGREVWIFKGVGRGKTEIRMKYFREWEKGKPPGRTATYSVTVE
jgi:predicted secreted protein